MSELLSWDWDNLLKIERQLDFFVNITVSASKKRNECVPHVALVCEYSRLRKFIVDGLANVFGGTLFNYLQLNGVKPGDIVAVLSNIKDDEMIVVNNGSFINKFTPEAFDIFRCALSSFTMELILGKGLGARKVVCELPKFSVVACFENINQISCDLKSCFEYVIDLNHISKADICCLEIQAIASENNMKFESSAIEKISDVSGEDYRKAGRCVRWIRDYILVNNEQFSIISCDYVSRILSLLN